MSAPISGNARDQDPNEVQRGATDPAASVWVAASAGTGKTKVLTDRVLRLLLNGTPPERILCLTFTKAAAAEMNNRIADILKGWASAPSSVLEDDLFYRLSRTPEDDERRRARSLFPAVLDVPGGVRIQTIHAFCQTVLARFPIEAGIAPQFTVLDDREQRALFALSRRSVLAAVDQSPDLAKALDRITGVIDQGTYQALLNEVAADRHRLRAAVDAYGSPGAVAAAVRERLGLSAETMPSDVLVTASDDTAFDAAGLQHCAEVLLNGSVSEVKRGEQIAAWLGSGTSDRATGFFQYAEAYLVTKGYFGEIRKSLLTKGTAKKHPDAELVLAVEAERVLAIVERWKAAMVAESTEAIIRLGSAFVEAYRRLRDAHSALDFDDLIQQTAALLEADGGASWVLYKLDGGIDHLLIDEAQDTSPEQWRVVRALTQEFFAGDGTGASGRTVFAVGDLKQSIYSFQGSDPAAFLAARNHFRGCVTDVRGDFREIPMQVSFRSTRAILAAVDAVFRRDEAVDGVALDGADVVHRSYRTRDGGSVEVWPPVRSRETDMPAPWLPPVERVSGDSPQSRMAELVAERIRRMIGHDVLESKGRPVVAGDVMVLVQRRGPFVEDLVRRLKGKDVPVAGVDRMVLVEQMAVMDLMALGRFALHPGDDLTLASLLKSPMIGLDEEQLFELAHDRGRRSLWSALAAKAPLGIAFEAARAQLSEVLRVADQLTPSGFYSHVLGPMEGRSRLLARLGWEADDPIAEFVDLAFQFEHTHPPSLEGFLYWVERTAVEVKRDLQSDTAEAVRVLTVHGAKGLQAPVVFLPDTMRVPRQRPKLLWIEPLGTDRSSTPLPLWSHVADVRVGLAREADEVASALQMQEYRRLLYVAMTRAEDRLIIGGWTGQRAEADGCWYRLIRAGLADAPAEHRVEEVEDAFLSVADAIDESRVLRLTCVQEHDAQPPEPQTMPVVPPLPLWARTPPLDEPKPPKPLTPSRPEAADPPTRSPRGTVGDNVRFRRGRLIHRLLQSLPDYPSASRADLALRWLDQPGHGLDAAARDEIVSTVLAVLDDPACATAFTPGSRPEVPITGVVAGRAISGQVDRLVVAGDEVTVLDYKTDRAPPPSPDKIPVAYCRQMASYRALLRLVYPGRSVRCLLIWTEGPIVTALSDDQLDRYAPEASGAASAV